MEICENCPNHKNGACSYSGNCLIKTEQKRIAAFKAVPVSEDAFNPFQRGNGCVLNVMKVKKAYVR